MAFRSQFSFKVKYSKLYLKSICHGILRINDVFFYVGMKSKPIELKSGFLFNCIVSTNFRLVREFFFPHQHHRSFISNSMERKKMEMLLALSLLMRTFDELMPLTKKIVL